MSFLFVQFDENSYLIRNPLAILMGDVIVVCPTWPNVPFDKNPLAILTKNINFFVWHD